MFPPLTMPTTFLPRISSRNLIALASDAAPEPSTTCFMTRRKRTASLICSWVADEVVQQRPQDFVRSSNGVRGEALVFRVHRGIGIEVPVAPGVPHCGRAVRLHSDHADVWIDVFCDDAIP